MAEEQEKTITESWDTSSIENESIGTIQETKEQLAEMYLNFLDQQRWSMISTWASMGINLNPFKKDAVEYLLTNQEEKTWFFDTLGKNIKKKVMEKLWWSTSLEYDTIKLNKMKSLIVENKDNQAKLEELMTQIQSGIDPTIEDVAAATTVAASTSALDQNSASSQQSESLYDQSIERIPGDYIYPVPGVKINSPFWPRVLNGKNEDHKGIDIADSTNQHDILSVGNGVVEYVATNEDDEFSWYGNCVVVKLENGYRVLYGHLESYTVKVWDKVESSQVIWVMGNSGCEWTGTHLHLEVREWTADDKLHSDDRAVYFNSKAIDPLRLLPVSKDMIQPDLLADKRISMSLLENQIA